MFTNVRSDEHQISIPCDLNPRAKVAKVGTDMRARGRAHARESAGGRGTFVKGCIGSPSFRERTTYRIRAAVGQRNFRAVGFLLRCADVYVGVQDGLPPSGRNGLKAAVIAPFDARRFGGPTWQPRLQSKASSRNRES